MRTGSRALASGQTLLRTVIVGVLLAAVLIRAGFVLVSVCFAIAIITVTFVIHLRIDATTCEARTHDAPNSRTPLRSSVAHGVAPPQLW